MINWGYVAGFYDGEGTMGFRVGRDKLGRFLKGHILSPKHIKFLKHNRGEKSPSWKGGKPKCSICGKKLSTYISKKCSKCFSDGRKGKNHPMYGVHRFGKNAPNYKGKNCKTPKIKIIRRSLKYQIWRNKIFKRDNWTCLLCNQRGGKLEAHHKKSFTHFPKLRFILKNGITLCLKCHKKIHTKKEREV